MTLQGIVNQIQNDPSVRDHTEKYRYHEQGSLSAAAHKKCPCPCFAVAVTFAGDKQQAHIQSWTSLGIVDIDNVRTYSEKRGHYLRSPSP
ncbi:BT4734/BF3469 family protein [Bacteroides clarus]|uniref:BT4734/BF3469 family protein n=1 Tax=Bacteroides clarus TaxID=626929 RepID=UPI0035206BB9